jgi:dipeptidase
MIPNWSILKELHPEDAKNCMVSANWQQAAIDRGWYDPAAGQPFIWQEIYAPLPQEFATSRFWLFHATFAPAYREWPDRKLSDDPLKGINPYYQYVEPLSIYPFSIRPERPVSVRDVIAFQRSVFEGTIYDLTADPNWLVPDGKGGYVKSPLATPFPGKDLRMLLKLTNRRPVARHRGHYGMVCQLRSWLPDPVGGVYWVYLDNPYFSPYVPFYAGVTETAACYQLYDPERFSEESARWAIDFVDNLAGLRFQNAIEDVRAVRDPWEERMFARQAEVEDEAVRLHGQNPAAARDFLTRYCVGLQDEIPPMFRQLREAIITKYTNNRE